MFILLLVVAAVARDVTPGFLGTVGCGHACQVTNVTGAYITIETDMGAACNPTIPYFHAHDFKYELPQPLAHFWCDMVSCEHAFDCGSLVVTIDVDETEIVYPYRHVAHGRLIYQLGDKTAEYIRD